MEKNSLENSGEQPKIKIKRSRRRLYQTEVNEKKTKKKPGKVVDTRVGVVKAKVKADDSKTGKPGKEKDSDVISSDREVKAKEIIQKNIYWSAGIGLLPFPVLDMAALVALQMKMVKDISRIYGIPFQESRGKSFILSLFGGINVISLSWIAWRSFLKFMPGIGGLMGVVSFSGFSAASTYAVGKVFIQHFEMGGTLLNFNPDKVKQYFREQYEEGKQMKMDD